MTPTLYLTRNGLLEPLGQSQVLAYLRGLARERPVVLVTFEKPEDHADAARMACARRDCAAAGIDWRPQLFRKGPSVLGPARDMLVMLRMALGAARAGKLGLIHARSYLPAGVALIAHRLTGAPFIFDMRALWPEELITAGRLRRGSPVHRGLAALERACLKRAAAVVSLTEAAVEHLRETRPDELRGQRVVVIPTCADLDRFTPAPRPDGPPVYGCIGTVLSGWFRIDWLAAFFAAVAAREPEARFEVVTRDDAAAVRAALGGGDAVQERLSVYAMPSERMPEAVRRQTASAMFFTDGLSKLGSSPTRMGEILGCGLPVIANAGVGDVARIIERHRVGVLARDGTPAAMAEALEALDALRADPDLAARCRAAAEAVFSLKAGTDAYRRLYADILSETAAPCAA